jgi:DNA-directed RNA polymerase subunit RPC12/RpoP
MRETGSLRCPTQDCGRRIKLSEPDSEGVRDWRCPDCGAFGYTLPPEYAADHPEEPFLQRVGGPARARKEVTR